MIQLHIFSLNYNFLLLSVHSSISSNGLWREKPVFFLEETPCILVHFLLFIKQIFRVYGLLVNDHQKLQMSKFENP